jgi:hemoglobin-like flavoprotein
MTPRQRMLVQSTYEMAIPRLNMVSDRFYSRLLKRDPHIRNLFKGDLKVQSQLFTKAISQVIQNLHDSVMVEEMLMDLGTRHRNYGITRTHYELASKVLIAAVRQATGIRFTYEIQKAWETFYLYVVDCMSRDAGGEGQDAPKMAAQK